MKIRFAQVALALSLLVAAPGCAGGLTTDIETAAEVDPKTDFSGMKTFGWLGTAGIVSDPENLWTPPSFDLAAHLKFLVDSELRSRGLEESETPDVAVAMLVVNDVQELAVIEKERAGEVPDLVGVGVGAILVEIVNVETGKTIWLAAAKGESKTNRSEEDTKKRLNYAVKQMFKELPR